MARARSDPGRDTAERLPARELMPAGVNGATDVELMRLDQVVKAEPDAAVLADADGGDRVVGLCALEAVHREASSVESSIADQRSPETPLPTSVRPRTALAAFAQRFVVCMC
jgi:hypothetical protein